MVNTEREKKVSEEWKQRQGSNVKSVDESLDHPPVKKFFYYAKHVGKDLNFSQLRRQRTRDPPI